MSGDALVNEHFVAEHHANVDMTVFDLTKKVCSYLGSLLPFNVAGAIEQYSFTLQSLTLSLTLFILG